MSIRLRLTLWYTGILSATLLLFGLGLYIFLQYIVYDSLQDELSGQAELVRKRIDIGASLSGDRFTFRFYFPTRDPVRSNNMLVQVVSLPEKKLYPSPEMAQTELNFPELSDKKLKCVLDQSCLFDRVIINGDGFLLYHTPITVNGTPVGVMQAAYPTYSYDRLFGILRLILTITALVTIILAASIGWFLARKALRPIERVIAAANQIEKGADLQKRIEYYGPVDEIGELTQTINGMLGRLQHAYLELEEAYSAQRRFVSDASHELRTPLTTIRGNVELLEKMWKQSLATARSEEAAKVELSLEAMGDISGEAERMTRLVNDLLSLARADAGFQIQKEHLALRPMLDEIGRKAQLLPRSVEWQFGDLTEANHVSVFGNQDYLRQLVFIFIENAFKYTDTGYVKMDVLRHDGQVGIRIEDSGIGMDKEEVPHIFDRFYRADPSRGRKSGTGLGLSIAQWIMDEHNGSVEVKTRKNEGSTFIIWLPVSVETLPGPSAAPSHSLPGPDQV